ncbi:MAG TPA: HNH endonuclease [Candidatus Aminicenantes bacterium]|nr:HNH endonuclease [Candidatus Aminicenantes bacterium]
MNNHYCLGNKVFHIRSFKCVNCDRVIPWNRRIKLFCSDICREEADFVRYVRSCKKDGRIERTDVQETIQIMFAHIASGGYPRKERHIPKQLREAVIARFNGLCAICGNPGSDIDHIDGNSNDLNNLQLLCRSCHNKKTKEKIKILTPGDKRYFEVLEKRQNLDFRIDSPEPNLECDDEVNWPKVYRKIISYRKNLYYSSLTPIIDELLKQGLGNKRIAEQFNIFHIPTSSGHGKWYKEMIKKIRLSQKLFLKSNNKGKI